MVHAWRAPAAQAWAKDFNGEWRTRERRQAGREDPLGTACARCGVGPDYLRAAVSARLRIVERDFSTMRRYWGPTGWADVETECGMCGLRHAIAPPAWALRRERQGQPTEPTEAHMAVPA